MSKPPPIRSQDATFDAGGFETVKADVITLSLALRVVPVTHLSSESRVCVPFGGVAAVYVITNTSTGGSTGANYHTIKCLRSGADESGRKVDTRQGEFLAYRVEYLGTFTVGPNDELALSLVVTGAPAPTLTTANLTMRVELTPTNEGA